MNAPGPKTKASQSHLRAFKRFCKVLVTNLVDIFPVKNEIMPCLVTEILNMSHSKLRLFRHGFT